VIATVQLTIGLLLRQEYDTRSLRFVLLGPIYPIAYWMIAAAAALHSQIGALVTGPRKERVVWDIEREGVPAATPRAD